MKQRIISALIAIPLFFAIVLWAPKPLYLGFWYAVVVACSYEFFKIRQFPKMPALLTAVCISSIAPILFYFQKLDTIPVISMAYVIPLIWLVIVPILFAQYARNHEYKSNNGLMIGLWFFIINFFFAFVSLFITATYSRWELIFILIIVWANDAGAYFVGKALGKRKFSPNISPNKTWEGFIGGIIIAMLTTVLLMRENIVLSLCIGFGIALLATIGDLFESMVKRMAGVKDSGNIMPGHGGVFDRIDSWLAVGSMAAAIKWVLSPWIL